MVEYLMISPLIAAIAGGIIGALFVFLTTLTGLFGYSNAAKWFASSTVWKRYGYRVSWGGSIVGAILGFIYGFLVWLIFSLIYNALL